MAPPLITVPIQGGPIRAHAACWLLQRVPGLLRTLHDRLRAPTLKAEGGVRSAGSRESLWSGNPFRRPVVGLPLLGTRAGGCIQEEVLRRSVRDRRSVPASRENPWR